MSPWVQEITLPESYRDMPNQTLFRHSSGTLFIGKANGLNILDGKRSGYLHMEGPVHVCGDAFDTLYYASRNDFGFLIRQGKDSYRRVSRIHLLPPSKRTFTPLGIRYQSGQVHILTSDAILAFSGNKAIFLEQNDELMAPFAPDTSLHGQIKELMARSEGIPTNEIRQIFQWGPSEIWILGTYTLHLVYHPSPLHTLDLEYSSTGRIYASILFEDQILLGTSKGIFRLSRNTVTGEQWELTELLPDIRHSVHLFSGMGDQVFAAGSMGLYVLGKDHAEIIDRGSYTGILALGRGNIVASDQEGILKYELTGTGWESTRLTRDLPLSHSFTRFNNQSFFLCNNEVFRINPQVDRISAVPVPAGESIRHIQQIGSYLYLKGEQNIFRYDVNEEAFHPLPPGKLTDLLEQAKKVIPSNTNQFWILGDAEEFPNHLILADSLDESPENYHAVPVLHHMGEITDIATSHGLLFLTGKDKISTFNLHFRNDTPGSVSIELIEKEAGEAAQGFRIVGFELQTVPEPLFRYRILPLDTLWSHWKSERVHHFSELRHGDYIIEAQAMDLFGRIAVSAPGVFIIPHPWYARWYAYLFYGILLMLLLALIQKWRMVSIQRAESRIAERMEKKFKGLAAEKKRSDKLITEMLPEDTASQIINKGKARWDKYERATVLFSDIQGFTKIAEEMNPESLIDELDSFFFHFDSVVEKYNIEKIKTIGDAYMAAGGIPHKNSTNPVEVVMAALEMQLYMKQLKATRARIWDLRIGIHTGPVIAGVVGHKKISYDIWGDTVNTASRMESSGTPGKINISGITYGMVKDYFICEYRGKLPVKYKGNIDMYYVNGLRPELSVDLMGIPNKRFFIKLQLLRLGDLEEKVFKDILNRLPDSLHFHRSEYARRVYNQTFLLCRAEEVEQEDRLLARTAALMLFTGLQQSYQNFENRSLVLCREILPDFAYSETQIDQICNLILSTKRPHAPKNQLEKILIDARMEYLGRPDYIREIQLLFRELKETGSKLNGQQFKKQQQELLHDFEFYTTAARRLREVSGDDQMTTLEQERWI